MIKQIGKFEFKDNLKDFSRFERRVPELIAVNTVNHFQEGFRKGGYQTDASLSGWEKRKAGARRAGRGILIDAGILWRDVKKRVVKFSEIVVGTGSTTIKYAQRHNEGLNGMPKREFIGDSKKLEASNEKIISKEMDKVMNV